MSIEIRRARPDDVDAIATIAQLSFGTAVDETHIRHLLLLNRNFTCAATLSNRVVGFADCFLTVSGEDEIRLELDLLGVHPSARGRGAGRQLVRSSIELARRLDVASIRALVAADNVVMQRLCAALQFQRETGSCALFVRSPTPTAAAQRNPAAACLIPVETLTYSGIWIEGDFSQPSISHALSVANQRKLETVGAVVSHADAAAQSLFRASGFACRGTFDWWTINL